MMSMTVGGIAWLWSRPDCKEGWGYVVREGDGDVAWGWSGDKDISMVGES